MLVRTDPRSRPTRSWRVPVLVVAATALAATALLGSPALAGVGTSADSIVSVKKELLETEKSDVGTILVDKSGRTVYVFMADKKGVSNCTGQCLTYWPVVVAPKKLPKSLPGVKGKLGFIKRTDNGVRQLTMNGWPLYLYAGDTKPGMIAGQGSNGGGALWWVVGPNGKKITTPLPSPSPSASA